MLKVPNEYWFVEYLLDRRVFLMTESESWSGCQNKVVAQKVQLISTTPHMKHIDGILIQSNILQ